MAKYTPSLFQCFTHYEAWLPEVRSSPLSPDTLSVTLDDIRAARIRLAPLLLPTPLRVYHELDDAVGHSVHVFVKHENFNPTGSFKVRNGLSFMTALPDESRARGVVAATRGNHGLGLSYAGRAFGVRTTVCVPVGNNPDKNAGMRSLGEVSHSFFAPRPNPSSEARPNGIAPGPRGAEEYHAPRGPGAIPLVPPQLKR